MTRDGGWSRVFSDTARATQPQQAIHCSPSTSSSDRMKPREYCCCAIPVINIGIYLTLTEQFVLGILAGTLSVATPSSNCAPILPGLLLRPLCPVVGAATPSFARWIFAAVCYVGAMIQVLGFIGVAKACIYPIYSLWVLTSSGCRKIPCYSEDTLLCMP